MVASALWKIMVRVQADECPKSPQEGWISGVVVVKHALFSLKETSACLAQGWPHYERVDSWDLAETLLETPY